MNNPNHDAPADTLFVKVGQEYKNPYDGRNGPTIRIIHVDGSQAVCIWRHGDDTQNPINAFAKSCADIAAEWKLISLNDMNSAYDEIKKWLLCKYQEHGLTTDAFPFAAMDLSSQWWAYQSEPRIQSHHFDIKNPSDKVIALGYSSGEMPPWKESLVKWNTSENQFSRDKSQDKENDIPANEPTGTQLFALAVNLERTVNDGLTLKTTNRQLLGYCYDVSEDAAVGSFLRKALLENKGFTFGEVLVISIPPQTNGIS